MAVVATLVIQKKAMISGTFVSNAPDARDEERGFREGKRAVGMGGNLGAGAKPKMRAPRTAQRA
jgi:hypothetical protein